MNTRTSPQTGTLTLARSFVHASSEHLDRLREGERMVRTDQDLEGVHLMRTSCRRLRATVKYLGDPLSRDARASLQDGLREVMGVLGRVRDLDVLRGAIDSVPSLGTSEAETLKEAIGERLKKATLEMQDTLDGEGYARLLGDLETATRAGDDGTPVAWVGPARLGAALSDLLRNHPADWTSAPEEALHELRKSVKKVRYALEAFAPAYGRPVSRAVERCRDLQESLGVIQDGSAFAELLKGIRTFSAGQFVATMRSRADAEKARLPGLWDKAFGPKGIERLGGHLFRRAVKSGQVRESQLGQRAAV